MMDDLLAHLFGEALFGKMGHTRRAQLLVRVFFGLLGAALGVAGAIHFALKTDFASNGPMRFSIIALFAFLAGFSLFNVALGRKWRWPAVLFVVSLVSVFATRIIFGT